MSDLDALLAGIVAHPAEDVGWLVLADRLRDHDQPERADLVEVHRRLLETAAEPDAYPEREHRNFAQPSRSSRPDSSSSGIRLVFRLHGPQTHFVPETIHMIFTDHHEVKPTFF